jgi:hypothetical protein
MLMRDAFANVPLATVPRFPRRDWQPLKGTIDHFFAGRLSISSKKVSRGHRVNPGIAAVCLRHSTLVHAVSMQLTCM